MTERNVMKTSIAKLVAAFLVVAAMAGCASMGEGNPLSSDSLNDVTYDPAFSIG